MSTFRTDVVGSGSTGQAERIDPEHWLLDRGWLCFERSKGGEPYWRRAPNEAGWEGGWNLSGAVHQQLQAENEATLKRMGLWRPLTRTARRSR